MPLVCTSSTEPSHRLGKTDRKERPLRYLEPSPASSNGIVGRSEAVRAMVREIDLVAQTDATVLVLGESGTGKELVAREIHMRSRRRHLPLIRVNCASVPKELYESEFFGHVKGAFTGAVKDRPGRFELADGGTLFLDEVGEIPLELQSKLLRVLQEGEYERVGEERSRRVDVRVIAATNRDLTKEVEAGRFRQDLYYRLNVYPIVVAPLRRRKTDIPLLATYLVDRSARRLQRPIPTLSDAQLERLQHYEWPGNVRELQNVIERAVIISQSGPLQFELPRERQTPQSLTVPILLPVSQRGNEILTGEAMQERERRNLLTALEASHWRIYGPGGAAERLGIKPTTLASRIKKLGLKKV